MPPILINSQSLTASGQLPVCRRKLQVQNDDLGSSLLEVPIASTGMNSTHSMDLPIYCPYLLSTEAGYSRDTRGLIRYISLIKSVYSNSVHPDTSGQEHQTLVQMY